MRMRIRTGIIIKQGEKIEVGAARDAPWKYMDGKVWRRKKRKETAASLECDRNQRTSKWKLLEM